MKQNILKKKNPINSETKLKNSKS